MNRKIRANGAKGKEILLKENDFEKEILNQSEKSFLEHWKPKFGTVSGDVFQITGKEYAKLLEHINRYIDNRGGEGSDGYWGTDKNINKMVDNFNPMSIGQLTLAVIPEKDVERIELLAGKDFIKCRYWNFYIVICSGHRRSEAIRRYFLKKDAKDFTFPILMIKQEDFKKTYEDSAIQVSHKSNSALFMSQTYELARILERIFKGADILDWTQPWQEKIATYVAIQHFRNDPVFKVENEDWFVPDILKFGSYKTKNCVIRSDYAFKIAMGIEPMSESEISESSKLAEDVMSKYEGLKLSKIDSFNTKMKKQLSKMEIGKSGLNISNNDIDEFVKFLKEYKALMSEYRVICAKSNGQNEEKEDRIYGKLPFLGVLLYDWFNGKKQLFGLGRKELATRMYRARDLIKTNLLFIKGCRLAGSDNSLKKPNLKDAIQFWFISKLNYQYKG